MGFPLLTEGMPPIGYDMVNTPPKIYGLPRGFIINTIMDSRAKGSTCMVLMCTTVSDAKFRRVHSSTFLVYTFESACSY